MEEMIKAKQSTTQQGKASNAPIGKVPTCSACDEDAHGILGHGARRMLLDAGGGGRREEEAAGRDTGGEQQLLDRRLWEARRGRAVRFIHTLTSLVSFHQS